MKDFFRAPAVRAASAALAAALLLCGWAARRAATLEPLPAAKPVAPAAAPALVRPRAEYPAEYLLVALRGDPFRPERQASATRFALPGERAAEAAAALPSDPVFAPPPPPEVRLTGTMMVPGGRPIALLAMGGEPARIVRAGEKIGPYTLSRVEPGRAVLAGPDGARLELRVSRPGS